MIIINEKIKVKIIINIFSILQQAKSGPLNFDEYAYQPRCDNAAERIIRKLSHHITIHPDEAVASELAEKVDGLRMRPNMNIFMS